VLQSLRKGVANDRFFLLLGICLLIFLVSFFLPVTRKAANNIFYVGVALPTLACLLCYPYALLAILRRYADVLLLLAGLMLLYAWRDPSDLKQLLYLTLLLASFAVLNVRSQDNCVRLFSVFAALAMMVLLASILWWLWLYVSTGSWVRLTLWGGAENPVHAALMLSTLLTFVWLFHVDPRLIGRSVLWRYSAIILLVVLGMLCTMVFQARSAILGLLLFLVGYLAWRRMLLGGLLIVLGVLILCWVLGLQNLLMERGVSFRLVIWQDVLDRVTHHCGLLLGCEPSSYRFLGQFYHPHNTYLALLYRTGVAGTLLFAAFTLTFFWIAVRGRSRWMLVSLIGWGAMLSSGSGIFSSPQPLWIYFWCPVLLALLEVRPLLLQQYLGGCVRSGSTSA